MPRNIGPYQGVCDFDEAAQITGYAPDTIRAYHGTTLDMPSIRIAGRIMFLKGELERWVTNRAESHRQHETAAAGAFRADEERRAAAPLAFWVDRVILHTQPPHDRRIMI